MAEYIHKYPGMPEGAKALMHHLKLDLVVCCNFSWREAHNKMLLAAPFSLDCLRKTLPPIDEDQRLALLHASFKGTTLFGGELAKLQEANMKRAATFTVFPTPTAPPVSYSSHPYDGRKSVFLTGRALRSRVDGAGDRADPCQPPLSLGLASLRKARHL